MNLAVVIPPFNGSKWIRKALESVFSQTHRPSEVVVVNDGSEDESPEIVRQFTNVQFLQNPSKGANQARKFGIEQTTAPLIAILDQDDVWHPDHLKLSCNILNDYPAYPISVATVRNFKAEQPPVIQSPTSSAEPWDPWETFPFSTISTPSSMVIHRSALDKAGGWPIQFVGVAESHTALRLSVGNLLMKNRSITVSRRVHGDCYSVTLRSRNACEYVANLRSSSQDLLNYRLDHHPDDMVMWSRRIRVLDRISEILGATAENNVDDLRENAYKFRVSTSVESTVFISQAYWSLVWFLYPSLYFGPAEKWYTVWPILFEHWPIEAKEAQQYILSSLPHEEEKE